MKLLRRLGVSGPICIVLIGVHLLVFATVVIAADMSYTVWRAAGFGLIYLAEISACVAVALAVREIHKRDKRAILWPLALLVFNVLPYVGIVLIGHFAGL